MKLFQRLKERRAEKRADRDAVATAAGESRRAGDDAPRSMSETVEDAAGQFPPAP